VERPAPAEKAGLTLRLAAAAIALAIAAVAPAPAAAAPADLVADARRFYRIVACAGTDPVEPAIAKIVAAHCKKLGRSIARFRKRYVDPAAAFFGAVRPANLPTTVVYPFGGGDLVSALITYPAATEITTVSLEHAGDPTRLGQLTAKELKKYLARFRQVARGLLSYTVSESKQLRLLERGPIPGQLAFHVTGAAVMGYEPVGLRYFRIADDGTIVYYTAAEIAALAGDTARRKLRTWVDTDWSIAYSNLELALHKAGDPTAPVILHRHIAANLDDDHFARSPLSRHLDAKGRVSAMTKSASYLLWTSAFTAIRDYLATHLAWMPSDSTGLPPRHAVGAGLEQETYGRFRGAALRAGKADQAAFVTLWKQQPSRKLRFRYGYRDARGHAHLVITRPTTTP
jgi:hypothetical protein